jgi:hypothetical protein
VRELRALEERFYALVTAPAGVARALADEGAPPASLDALFAGDARLSALERLDVYANMYFFRIRDVLIEEYPRLVAALGDAAFHNLATDFVWRAPPRRFSMRDAGAELPAFLRAHAFGLERPELADLARLERERIEVFDAADAAPLVEADVRALGPDALGALALRFVPAHVVFDVAWNVDELWDGGTDADADAAPRRAPGRVVVWRDGAGGVYHRRLGDLERAVWPGARGTTFGALCERLCEGRAVDEAAPLAFALLARWVADGLLARDELARDGLPRDERQEGT